jgi:hypothetical protein
VPGLPGAPKAPGGITPALGGAAVVVTSDMLKPIAGSAAEQYFLDKYGKVPFSGTPMKSTGTWTRPESRFQYPARISQEVNIKVPITINTEVNVSGAQRVTYLSSQASRTATKTQDTTISPVASWGDWAGFDFSGMNY